MRIAFDSNILAYLAGVDRAADDGAKIDRVRAVLASLAGRAALVAPVQTLGELLIVLVRAGASREEARTVVLRFRETFACADTSEATLLSAMDLVVAHKLQLWDALILSASAEAGCAMLLSEDMQDGFVWRGVTVRNPLTTPINVAPAG
jgi:predicted nucleic acid-binding protein